MQLQMLAFIIRYFAGFVFFFLNGGGLLRAMISKQPGGGLQKALQFNVKNPSLLT
jgi:hypothetical protein